MLLAESSAMETRTKGEVEVEEKDEASRGDEEEVE